MVSWWLDSAIGDVPQDHHYVAAACGENHTVLLCKDRTVLAVGDDRHGQCQAGRRTQLTRERNRSK